MLELVRLVWRRQVFIAAAGLICACAAVAIGKSLTPRYSATAQLYVDPRELQLVDRELTPRAQDTSGLSMVVESQARLITSNNVLLQVIQDTHLDKDPEFGGETKGMMASLLGLFGIVIHSPDETKLGQMAALEALGRHINVKKTDRSFIVDIDVWSRDPAKAAMLANALANAYLAESKNSQSTAARRATTDLSGRLKELKATAPYRRERAGGLQGAEQFRRHPGHADQRPAAFSQQPATRRGAGADARRAGEIRPDRGQPPHVDRCRRHSRSAAVTDHCQFTRRNMPKLASVMPN